MEGVNECLVVVGGAAREPCGSQSAGAPRPLCLHFRYLHDFREYELVRGWIVIVLFRSIYTYLPKEDPSLSYIELAMSSLSLIVHPPQQGVYTQTKK